MATKSRANDRKVNERVRGARAQAKAGAGRTPEVRKAATPPTLSHSDRRARRQAIAEASKSKDVGAVAREFGVGIRTVFDAIREFKGAATQGAI